jgi:hypothetical protein
MRLHRTILATAVMLAAGCQAGQDKAEAPTDAPDFRDGSYFYVLGYDPDSGEQIRGGAHAVVGFDENGKTEPIDSANRVSRFHPDMTPSSDYYLFDATLTQGETDWEVFPSTWWPQSRNGTAWRWQPGSSDDYNDRSDVDRLSPMEKYDMLFHPGQETTVDAVSHCEYADYVEDPDNCDQIEHPEVEVAGPATAWELENQGVYQWVEPENWWGHCNGWASYATTEPLGYPRRDIRVRLENGQVTECTDDTDGCILWRMADIEALFTELYFSDRATFSGQRCNTRPDELERDEFGRVTETACRDINPGSFHVAIVGSLGRGARNLTTNEDGHHAFVIDHNWDYEIWNFPVISYEINSSEDVTEEQAHELVGGSGSDYQWNSEATRFVRVQLTYEMISDGVASWDLVNRADQRSLHPVPVELNYVLELDDENRILGGEWIEDPVVTWGENSKELHPDFIWMATDPVGWGESSDDTGGDNDNPHISLTDARMLLRCANEPETCAPEGGGGGGGGGGGEITNITDLVGRDQTVDVDTGVVEAGRYTITLSHTADNPGGDADLYVRVGSAPTTSTFDCRPYLSGSDEVCTVELTAADTIFVSVRGYAFGDNHFNLTIVGDGGGGGGGGGDEEWDGLSGSGTVAQNAEDRFETPELPAGTYQFAMTGTGDADLYVRTGSAPTTSQWDCRPYTSGSTETCTVTLSSPSTIHAMVRGYASSSTYQLTGSRQ